MSRTDRGAPIHLLYFDGCPNVEQARQNLRVALARAGRQAEWTEMDVHASDVPAGWKGFPSPTVLIDGRDTISGADNADGNGACRYGGAPSVEAILTGLSAGKNTWLPPISAAPAALMGLAPGLFCPACYPALVGLLSSVGLGALVTDAILLPLMAAFLLVALGSLGLQARRSRFYWPLLPGILGSVGVFMGLFFVPSRIMRILGVILLVGASVWNVVQQFRKKKSTKTCPSCG